MSSHKKKRAIKLRAVSTPGQAGPDEASLPTQDDVLNEMAARRGVEIIDDIVIPGFSRDFYSWHDFTVAAKAKDIDAGERMLAHWNAKDFDEVLVYDGTRFARKESIFLEFYLRTRDIGATIVRHLGGEMTMTDIGPTMFEAYASGQEMRTRKERLKMGHEKRFRDGRHRTHLSITHIELHDEKHKPLGIYELNPAMTPIWRDVKTLLLEGTGWKNFEPELYKRFGHVNPTTGRPFIAGFFYRLLTQSPMVFGIIARGHSQGKVKEAEEGLPRRRAGETPFIYHWMYDPRVPVPPHITIQRGACPAVFTGKDYDDVVAELRSRREKHGRNAAALTYPFTSLCMCDVCRGVMSVMRGGKRDEAGLRRRQYMRCNYTYHNCENHTAIRFEIIQAYVTALLEHIVQAHDWPMSVADEGRDAMTRDDELRREVERINGQIDTLITELSEAGIPQVARQKIRQRLTDLDHRLEVIRAARDGLERATRQVAQRKHIVEEAIVYLEKVTIPGLWDLPALEINQFLRRLFDGRKLVIRGKEIVGVL